ncbi:30S ribosomal protein S15 [Candidatus Peregrinibacteria bacterium RIFOXYC2_FULL_33_13]|nr:MAG: 30S ribosomal protein S15 [Candidatus Peregrinibacteria bacterium GW2011_GWA2_33_10]KKP39522.1 MAG: 30S ribosomal protein S15, small subunit ribosomal protein S15 [Candidatus Peregrinibacteria bacterium GW2011_GWC2_33_13]OGJ46653.1 MAG: 30S ribosomal protein S15 [Candidatus Peregrinibacteria bacterium RIFOXYA2_FULL_33_7]OGJ53155.1 MAG: 30S ribosomal protein S15 [Candidatus Peregrinibacteria bacterium RIFOXYC2_FULL_33_13]
MKREEKKQLIKKHAVHAKDTGSAQVQTAIITTRINKLSDHLKTHPKDFHSKRGLLMMVGKRRKLLNYLKTTKKDLYQSLIENLNLRK